MNFNGKRIVLLGGTAGIGSATAVAAAREGATVVVASAGQARGRGRGFGTSLPLLNAGGFQHGADDRGGWWCCAGMSEALRSQENSFEATATVQLIADALLGIILSAIQLLSFFPRLSYILTD